ncbi:hypothetical protein KC19_12G076200 [Ceratodon purpureus]|uniref:Uncharacterized protein n=1 Tax=Ceratodon purpureus TaxID=3225 RepID=A0A8T0G5X3_CERPU|nr:hypothetical protein KC19_12G076200 [Ceratodon purpureus]
MPQSEERIVRAPASAQMSPPRSRLRFQYQTLHGPNEVSKIELLEIAQLGGGTQNTLLESETRQQSKLITTFVFPSDSPPAHKYSKQVPRPAPTVRGFDDRKVV